MHFCIKYGLWSSFEFSGLDGFLRLFFFFFFSSFFFFAFSRVQLGSAIFVSLSISNRVIDIWFWLQMIYEWMPFALDLLFRITSGPGGSQPS
jgi:hypothetical protein